MNDYFTLKNEAEDTYIINKSRFICYAKPVSGTDEANAFINEIKTRHREATHNVYAFNIREPLYSRYSDDGEPQGTAGVPVLDVIKKNALTDCCIVITRYFGGILLGAGGLVRAYSHSASLAAAAAGIIKMSLCSVMEVRCDYSFYGKLTTLLQDTGAVTEDSDFGAEVSVRFRLPCEKEDNFRKLLTESSFGRVTAEKVSEKYDCISF